LRRWARAWRPPPARPPAQSSGWMWINQPS
jgi:hypothetical protein